MFANQEDLKQEYYQMNIFEAFCQRLKKNLRIVVSLNHNQSNFTQNCSSNPALFTKCSIIWLSQLNHQSKLQILQDELKDIIKTSDPKTS